MFKVFLADDSPIIRHRLVALIIELSGLDIVGIVQSGTEAVAGIAALKPDALILDIHMPDGNGFDALKIIKQRPDAPVVIVLTNYPEYRQRCLDAGADYFFDKSAEFERVPELLEQLKQNFDTNLHLPA